MSVLGLRGPRGRTWCKKDEVHRSSSATAGRIWKVGRQSEPGQAMARQGGRLTAGRQQGIDGGRLPGKGRPGGKGMQWCCATNERVEGKSSSRNHECRKSRVCLYAALPSSELHLTRVAGRRPKSIEHGATLSILDGLEEKTTAWHQSGLSSAPFGVKQLRPKLHRLDTGQMGSYCTVLLCRSRNPGPAPSTR